MSDETKSIDRWIAEFHLHRALRPYRTSRAFVLVVVIPGDDGAGHWQQAAYDILKANESPATTKRASSPTKAPGSSSTEASKLRRDAVSQLAKRLR